LHKRLSMTFNPFAFAACLQSLKKYLVSMHGKGPVPRNMRNILIAAKKCFVWQSFAPRNERTKARSLAIKPSSGLNPFVKRERQPRQGSPWQPTRRREALSARGACDQLGETLAVLFLLPRSSSDEMMRVSNVWVFWRAIKHVCDIDVCYAKGEKVKGLPFIFQTKVAIFVLERAGEVR